MGLILSQTVNKGVRLSIPASAEPRTIEVIVCPANSIREARLRFEADRDVRIDRFDPAKKEAKRQG